ncbi:MAG TPA: hypothetical protein VLB44_22915, partial [Kofleriaceae bacterium]|nr:hypothetical protein [Kofleriaceae bacterium]
DKLLGEVLAHPSARFLSKLRLGMPMDPEDGEQDYADVIKALAKTEALGRLRELFIGDITQEESEISWVNVGDLSPLYKTAKNLRKLTIHAGSDVKLGKLELPELRELVIITGGFDKKNLASILSAKLPKLEVLEIWFGRPNYGGNCTMKDLKPLLDGKASFPKLKELGICNCEFADEVAAALATSKILPKLESLDLSKGTLTDTGVTAMLEHADAFQHLRKINLSDNYVGKTSAAAAKLCKAVRTRPQRTPDNWDGEDRRYAALGE